MGKIGSGYQWQPLTTIPTVENQPYGFTSSKTGTQPFIVDPNSGLVHILGLASTGFGILSVPQNGSMEWGADIDLQNFQLIIPRDDYTVAVADPSLAMDENGYFHIVFWEQTSAFYNNQPHTLVTLKYATNESGLWVVSTIKSQITVFYNTIAEDQFGNVGFARRASDGLMVAATHFRTEANPYWGMQFALFYNEGSGWLEADTSAFIGGTDIGFTCNNLGVDVRFSSDGKVHFAWVSNDPTGVRNSGTFTNLYSPVYACHLGYDWNIAASLTGKVFTGLYGETNPGPPDYPVGNTSVHIQNGPTPPRVLCFDDGEVGVIFAQAHYQTPIMQGLYYIRKLAGQSTWSDLIEVMPSGASVNGDIGYQLGGGQYDVLNDEYIFPCSCVAIGNANWIVDEPLLSEGLCTYRMKYSSIAGVWEAADAPYAIFSWRTDGSKYSQAPNYYTPNSISRVIYPQAQGYYRRGFSVIYLPYEKPAAETVLTAYGATLAFGYYLGYEWVVASILMWYVTDETEALGLGDSSNSTALDLDIYALLGFWDLQALALKDLVYDIITDSFFFLAQNDVYIGVEGSFALDYEIVPSTWMKKDALGNALVLSFDIKQNISTSFELLTSLLEKDIVTKELNMYFDIGVDISNITYDLRVTLDGDNGNVGTDITNKIKEIAITYSMDQYCGECEIVWLDWKMFDIFDIANSDYFGKLRLKIETKMDDDDWVSQGEFLVEKRNTTVTPEGVALTTWGRSKTALLGEPYGVPRSTGWDTDKPASNIVRELIMETNDLLGLLVPIDISWEIYDYTVLANKLFVDSQFPIEVITTLAEALGAVVTTDQTGNLKVIYRYG